MAKVSAHGTELARIERVDTPEVCGARYRAMSDGVILKQLYIAGRWRAPTIARRCADAQEAVRRVTANANKGGFYCPTGAGR